MTYSIPDLLSRNGSCVRNFREIFAKVAVPLDKISKGKLQWFQKKVWAGPSGGDGDGGDGGSDGGGGRGVKSPPSTRWTPVDSGGLGRLVDSVVDWWTGGLGGLLKEERRESTR